MNFENILPNVLQISHYGGQRPTDAGMQIQFPSSYRKMSIEFTVWIQMDDIVADDNIFSVCIEVRCNSRFEYFGCRTSIECGYLLWRCCISSPSIGLQTRLKCVRYLQTTLLNLLHLVFTRLKIENIYLLANHSGTKCSAVVLPYVL